MGLSELALNWYIVLTTLNAAVAEPLMALTSGAGVSLVAALLLVLLGATSPCQVTTNASALAFVSRRLESPRASLASALAYLLGKLLVYTLVGTAVVLAGRELATGLIPAIGVVRKALGPLMLLIGLSFLGVLRLNVAVGHGFSAWLQERALHGSRRAAAPDVGEAEAQSPPEKKRGASGGSGPRGGFLLGVAYGFAFCPTLFWLFFGLTIPLALRSSLGVLYPPVFALGTTLPLLGLAGLLALGAGQAAGYVRGVRRANRLLERVAGVVLVLAGLNDTFIYWFL